MKTVKEEDLIQEYFPYYHKNRKEFVADMVIGEMSCALFRLQKTGNMVLLEDIGNMSEEQMLRTKSMVGLIKANKISQADQSVLEDCMKDPSLMKMLTDLKNGTLKAVPNT